MTIKSVKLKSSTIAVTLASPMSPLGHQPSGAIIYEITGIPEEIPSTTIVRIANTCVFPTDRVKISWDEIRDGGAFLRNRTGRFF